MKTLIFLAIISQCLFVKAQTHLIRFTFRTTLHGDAKDSTNKDLVEINYFNKRRQTLKNVVIGPELTDTCWTIYVYDKNDNILNQISHCSDSVLRTDTSFHHYRYDKNGIITIDTFLQHQPIPEYSITIEEKNSTIKYFFETPQDIENGKFQYKSVSVYDFQKRIIKEFSVSSNNDTTIYNKSFYCRLSDTSAARAKINSQENHLHLVFLDDKGRDVLTEYYESGEYTGCRKTTYKNNRKSLEELYGARQQKLENRTSYSYDTKGRQLKKKNENLLTGLTIVTLYKNGLPTRTDYYYGGHLDHSIVYVYKTMAGDH